MVPTLLSLLMVRVRICSWVIDPFPVAIGHCQLPTECEGRLEALVDPSLKRVLIFIIHYHSIFIIIIIITNKIMIFTCLIVT